MKKILTPVLISGLALAASAAQAATLLNPCTIGYAPVIPGTDFADAVGTCNDTSAAVEVLIGNNAYYYENFEQVSSSHSIWTTTRPLNPTGAVDGWFVTAAYNPPGGAAATSYTGFGHNHAYAESLFGGEEYDSQGNWERSLSFAASARSQWVDVLTFDANGTYSATFTVDGSAGGLSGGFTAWFYGSPDGYESQRNWEFDVSVTGLDDGVNAILSMGDGGQNLSDSFNQSGTLNFNYSAGKSYLIVATLDVGVSNGGAVDFYNTATLSGLSLSAGNMSALSGTDYFNLGSTVAPPIPEPETYALILAGLGLVGWAARRRVHRS